MWYNIYLLVQRHSEKRIQVNHYFPLRSNSPSLIIFYQLQIEYGKLSTHRQMILRRSRFSASTSFDTQKPISWHNSNINHSSCEKLLCTSTALHSKFMPAFFTSLHQDFLWSLVGQSHWKYRGRGSGRGH